MAAYYDGMEFQKNFVNTMFYMNPGFAQPDADLGRRHRRLRRRSGQLRHVPLFLDNLQFSDLQGAYAQFASDPAMFQQIMGLLMQDPDVPVRALRLEERHLLHDAACA